MQKHVEAICRHLERLGGIRGVFVRTVFEDWVTATCYSLERLPDHARALQAGHTLDPDPEDMQKHWHLCASRYQSDWQRVFGACLAELINAATEYTDTVGQVYMQLEIGNVRAGQYFTPEPVARMMAELQDIPGVVHQHLKAALLHPENVLGAAVLLGASLAQTPAEAEAYFFRHVLPAALPYFQRVRLHDPCCGSGVMFLGAASTCPRWMFDYGLIAFSGTDIDRTCVLMARINLMLYQLGPDSWIRQINALTLQDYEAKPTPPPTRVLEQPALSQYKQGLLLPG